MYHPEYSPNFGPSGYHLVPYLQEYQTDQRFRRDDQIKKTKERDERKVGDGALKHTKYKIRKYKNLSTDYKNALEKMATTQQIVGKIHLFNDFILSLEKFLSG